MIVAIIVPTLSWVKSMNQGSDVHVFLLPRFKNQFANCRKIFYDEIRGKTLTQNAKIVPPRAVKSLYQHTDIHLLVDINDAKLYRISKAAGVNWARRQRQLNFTSCVFFFPSFSLFPVGTGHLVLFLSIDRPCPI